jgi:hypothetical protein
MFSYKRALAIALATAASVVLPTISHADTIIDYNLNQAQCGGTGCGEVAGFSFGTVVLDIATGGSSATITYNLTTGLFHDPGVDASAAAAMTGVTSWSVTSDSEALSNVLYTWANVTNPGMDGAGTFTLGDQCTDTSKSSNTCGSHLGISVIGSSLASALSTGGNGGFFAAVDLVNTFASSSTTCANDSGTFADGICTVTGVVATSLALATPVPGALALFGSVLFGGLGLSTWRKRRGGRRAISVLA